MACFIVSGAEAIVVKAVEKVEEKKELKRIESGESAEATGKIPLSRKLNWLSKMLCGGVTLLAFEHIWHGEVVPYFPFLTAMNDPADTAEMLHEMATVGVCMAVLITAVWVCMCVVADAIVKRSAKDSQTNEA